MLDRVVLACACAFAYNLVPYFLLIPSRLDNHTQQASYWAPAIHYLRAHKQPGYRVEVVPTAEHWEAYWVPKAGLTLARGWYQQIDEADNPIFYSQNLNGATYVAWLRHNAVRLKIRLEPRRVCISSTFQADDMPWRGGDKRGHRR